MLADPRHFVLLVIFNGGPRFFEINRKALDDITEKFEKMGGKDTINIVRANAATAPDPNSRDKYAPPFTLIAEVHKPSLRRTLINQQTLAFSTELAVHALPANETTLSWSVGLFTTTMRGKPDTIAETFRWVVASTLWHDDGFRTLVDRATQVQNEDSLDSRVYAATTSIDTRLIEHADGPVWLLMMAPCSKDFKTFEMIKQYIRSKKYYERQFLFAAHSIHGNGGKHRAICVICKLDTHPSYNCSFAKRTPDWWGPKEQLSQPPRESNRGRGRGVSRGVNRGSRRGEYGYGQSNRARR